jgi:nucleoside-diphosphate-sugar epimerase
MSLPDAVVLFGASGFIGRNVVQALARRLELLVGVNSTGREVPGCTWTVAADRLETIPHLPKSTIIVHVAASRYVASRFAQQQADIIGANLELTDRVYRFAMQRRLSEVRFASSSAVYPAMWPLLDDTRPVDLNLWPHESEAAYAWSKRWGEIAAELWRRHAGINTISLRLTNPYGPFDTLLESSAHVATAFIIRALGDSPDFEIRGDPTAERDFVYAGDVAAAFVESLSLRGITEGVNCAAGQAVRVDRLAQTVMRVEGRERPLRIVPPPVGANSGVRLRRATAERLRALLPAMPGFRSLEEGIRETLEWYRDALR